LKTFRVSMLGGEKVRVRNANLGPVCGSYYCGTVRYSGSRVVNGAFVGSYEKVGLDTLLVVNA